MARPGKKRKTALFIVEILCLLLFIGGLYVYGQIDSRLNKIETPQLDESKIVTNVTAPQMTGYTTYALFAIDKRSKNAALDAQNSDTIIVASINNDTRTHCPHMKYHYQGECSICIRRPGAGDFHAEYHAGSEYYRLCDGKLQCNGRSGRCFRRT